jgi:hypothetical protein
MKMIIFTVLPLVRKFRHLIILIPFCFILVALVSSRRALRDSTKVFMSCVCLYIAKYYID